MGRRLFAASVFVVVAAGCASPLLAEERPAVGNWRLDGDLVDRSGRGNDAFGAAAFTTGHGGQRLRCGKGAVVVPDSPELRPAPGLQIECGARLDAIGTSWQPLLIKDRGYQLRVETVTIRFQNHTPVTEMRLRFTTEADAVWDDAKSKVFSVVANDNGCRTCGVDMSAAPAWKGRLRLLRFDLAMGKTLTGTCRFDYVWITRPPE
ncbi:MAG: hypothetical protein HUU20_10990 [Pirellulales bacterium]|nr:hypothetical protein [Pirellulales bacterium]